MKRPLFFLFFLFLFTLPAAAGYQLDSIAVTAEAGVGGRVQVTNTVQLTFDGVTDQVVIPVYQTGITHVSATDYKCATREVGADTEIILTRKDGFSGVQTFTVTYTVPYDVCYTPGEEGGTFSLGLLSTRWKQPVPTCSFQVLMPKGFTETPQIVSGYFGALDPRTTALVSTETSFGGTVSDSQSSETLAATLALPADYFEVRSATLPVVSVTYLSLGMLAVLLLLVVYWRLKLRSPRAGSAPRRMMPEGLLPCQLPTVLDGTTCDIAALLLEWANLGYLSISQAPSGVVLLTRRMAMGSERSRAEQQLFARIFGKKVRVAATPGRFAGAGARFRAASRRSLYRTILDRTGGNPVLVQLPCRILLAVGVGHLGRTLLPEGGGFLALAVLIGLVGFVYSVFLHSAVAEFAVYRTVTRGGVLCLAIMLGLAALSLFAGALPEVLLGLIAVLFSGVATAPGPRRSQRGVDAMTQTRGLRTSYRTYGWQRLQVIQDRDSRFFQTQLPRAAALRVDRQFAARFERLTIPMPEWLDLPRAPERSAKALQKQLRHILRQLRNAF